MNGFESNGGPNRTARSQHGWMPALCHLVFVCMQGGGGNGSCCIFARWHLTALLCPSPACCLRLQAEAERRRAHVEGVELRLRRDKGLFFKATRRPNCWVAMVQECIMPRALQSPADALYCAKFMLKMHEMEAGNLNIPMYFNDVSLCVAAPRPHARPHGRLGHACMHAWWLRSVA